MAKDKNGTELAVGDVVLLRARIIAVDDRAAYDLVVETLETVHEPTEDDPSHFSSINLAGRQVERG